MFPLGELGESGDFWGSQERCQGPFRPSGRNRGSRGDRPLVDLYVELAGFSNDAGGCQTPSFCAFAFPLKKVKKTHKEGSEVGTASGVL